MWKQFSSWILYSSELTFFNFAKKKISSKWQQQSMGILFHDRRLHVNYGYNLKHHPTGLP